MTTQLPVGVDYEENPYPKVVPAATADLIPDLFTFLQSLTDRTREQHTLMVSGDSPVPWQRMNGIDKSAMHTLGSLGRFTHPIYGLIRARYVQFYQPLSSIWTGVPLGYANTTTGFVWKVTSDISKSAVNRVAGIQAGYTVPADGQFGWVIEDGVNTQSVIFTGGSAPTVGMKLAWVSPTYVQSATTGFATVADVSGIVVVDATHWELPPGSIQIRV